MGALRPRSFLVIKRPRISIYPASRPNGLRIKYRRWPERWKQQIRCSGTRNHQILQIELIHFCFEREMEQQSPWLRGLGLKSSSQQGLLISHSLIRCSRLSAWQRLQGMVEAWGLQLPRVLPRWPRRLHWSVPDNYIQQSAWKDSKTSTFKQQLIKMLGNWTWLFRCQPKTPTSQIYIENQLSRLTTNQSLIR